MNIKNNKRRRESIEKMEKVFIEMLQTREVDEISVTDICKQAGLNRSTFYANFIDIYDLAEKVEKHLVENFFSLFEAEIEQKTSTNNFLKLFKNIYENQLFYRTYFKLCKDNTALIGYDTIKAEKHFNSKYIDYHIEFFKSGFNAIIKKWLNEGCKETPEEMEEILKIEYLRKSFE